MFIRSCHCQEDITQVGGEREIVIGFNQTETKEIASGLRSPG